MHYWENYYKDFWIYAVVEISVNGFVPIKLEAESCINPWLGWRLLSEFLGGWEKQVGNGAGDTWAWGWRGRVRLGTWERQRWDRPDWKPGKKVGGVGREEGQERCVCGWCTAWLEWKKEEEKNWLELAVAPVGIPFYFASCGMLSSQGARNGLQGCCLSGLLPWLCRVVLHVKAAAWIQLHGPF